MERRFVRRVLRAGTLAAAAAAAAVAFIFYPPPRRTVEFPGGKRFAFTIVDDTDLTTLDRARPIYDALHRAGMRTTKTVWPLEPDGEPDETNRGATLRDPAYREWVVDLKRKGFEIALHGVRGTTSERQMILAGLDEFKDVVGHYPRVHVNHALNRDNLYWGSHRWAFAPYRWAFRVARSYDFFGHVPESPFFWGDIAEQHVHYVRRNTFTELNLLRVSPWLPYRLPGMPYIKYWFDASDGSTIHAFDRLLADENLDRLERDGGVAIVFSHLGAGSFNRDSEADPRFLARLDAVASRNGWFVPVSEILDYLAEQPGWSEDLSFRGRLRLETKFLVDRLY
jgi:hypothetical protein